MEKRFLPSKAWEWAVAALCLLILVAIFLPVYAYSGPGLSYGRVARDLESHHRLNASWSRNEKEHPIGRIPPNQSYSYALRNVLPRGALYRIVVDGRAELWRVDEGRRAKRLAAD